MCVACRCCCSFCPADSAVAPATPSRETALELLRQARPDLLKDQRPSWELALHRHFPFEMNSACMLQNVNLMRDLCSRYEALPKSTTVRVFLQQNIALGDPLHVKPSAGSGDSKVVLYYGTQLRMEEGVEVCVPVVLKKFSPDERLGYVAINKLDRTQRELHHLAPFTFFQAKSPVSTPAPSSPADPAAASSAAAAAASASLSDAPPQGATIQRTPVKKRGAAAGAPSTPVSFVLRDWAVMPHYPTTLASYARPFVGKRLAVATKLMAQMVAALDFLHDSQRAHVHVRE